MKPKPGEQLDNGYILAAATPLDEDGVCIVLGISMDGHYATWKYVRGATIWGEYFRENFYAAVSNMKDRATTEETMEEPWMR